MAKISDAFIRKSFLRQYARYSPEKRLGTLEALTVTHEMRTEEEAMDRKPSLLPDSQVEPDDELEGKE